MLSNKRFSIAESYGTAVAHSNFIYFLNPEHRGPNFTWDDLEHISCNQARFGVYSCGGDFGKDLKEMQEIASKSAKYVIDRCFKESNIKEWLPCKK